jgi:excisionase family DNA binding protein
MGKETNAYIPRKRLYTIIEAAEYLGHTVWGVRSLVWGKKLPVVQHGRKQFIDLEDMNRFIEKNKK